MSTRPTQKIAALAAGILITLSTTAAGCSSATDAGSAQAVAKTTGTPVAVTDDGTHILIITPQHDVYGGELFSLVLKRVTTGQTWTVADRLRYIDEDATLSADGRFVVWSDFDTIYRWDRNSGASTEVYGLGVGGNTKEYEIDLASSSRGFVSLSVGFEGGSIPIKLLNTSTLAITSISASKYSVVCGISDDGSRYAIHDDYVESVRSTATGAMVSGSKATPRKTEYCTGSSLSGDGKTLVFESDAASLPSGRPNTAGNTNLYAYSLATGTYTPILRDHVPTWSTSISNNGRYVFFIAERDLVGDGGTFQVYRFDLQTKTTIRITPKRNAGEFVTSPSGNRVLYQAGSYFYLWTA